MTWTVIQIEPNSGIIRSDVLNAPHDVKSAWKEICENLNDNSNHNNKDYKVIAIVPGNHPVHSLTSMLVKDV